MTGEGPAREVGLTLLDGVSWQGHPLPGERSHALLAALALDPTRARPDARLADEVWGPDDRPANPVKALQVLVSRLRSQTDPDLVVRVGPGYRLGVPEARVDALALRSLATPGPRGGAARRPAGRP